MTDGSFLSLYFQLTLPTFPVVVKIGHAHSGMGKVRLGPAGIAGWGTGYLLSPLSPVQQMQLLSPGKRRKKESGVGVGVGDTWREGIPWDLGLCL